jgi:hypothetical protein
MRNTPEQIQTDSLDLQRAFEADRQAYRQRLIDDGHTSEAVDEAFRLLEAANQTLGRN